MILIYDNTSSLYDDLIKLLNIARKISVKWNEKNFNIK